MSMKQELRFTGSGGQGVILASVIMAEAAILSGINAIQSQSYGPEARGGTSKAETIISDEELWFSKVTHPTFLLALTQSSLEKYAPESDEDCIILMDSSLTLPEGIKAKKVYSLPILETARQELGKPMTANIVALGAINAILHLFSQEDMEAAVKLHIPKGTENLNMSALKAGEKLVA